jgi:hypothetical protein
MDGSYLQLVHPKVMITLVAPKLFPARIPGNNFKLALGFAFWAAAVDGFPGHD